MEIIPKKKDKMYVDGERLTLELTKYAADYKYAEKNDLPLPRMNNFIGKAITDISTHQASRYCFSGYSYKDEMIAEGILVAVKYSHNFNPDKITKQGKATGFGYLSFNISQAFLSIIEIEKKAAYIKWKALSEFGDSDNLENEEDRINFNEYDSESETPRGLMFADVNDRIYSYEEKMKIRRNIQKEKYISKQKEKKTKRPTAMNLFEEE